jgi:hypothetical protein
LVVLHVGFGGDPVWRDMNRTSDRRQIIQREDFSRARQIQVDFVNSLYG